MVLEPPRLSKVVIIRVRRGEGNREENQRSDDVPLLGILAGVLLAGEQVWICGFKYQVQHFLV